MKKRSVQINQSWKDVLDEFLVEQRGNRISERTIKDYLWHVGQTYRPGIAWGDTETERKAIAAYVGKPEISDVTRNKRITYLRRFYRWAKERRFRADDPTDRFRKFKEDVKEKSIPEGDAARIRAIFASRYEKTHNYISLRNLCHFDLMLGLGIRPSEIRRILPTDINFAGGTLTIRQLKGSRADRVLPLLDILKRELSCLVEAHNKEVLEGRFSKDTPLFCRPNSGRPVSDTGFYTIFHRFCRSLGLEGRRYSPYGLRHTFATGLAKQDEPIYKVMHLMGHKQMTTTKRYFDIRTDDLRETVTNSSPLNRVTQKGEVRKRRPTVKA